jgi:hypothetical protein
MPALALQSVQDDALLEQSYNLSQKLGGLERVYHLIELCRVSSQLQPPAARAKEFCAELYNIGSTEQDQKLRTLAQKNAVTYLSFVDAPRAMELLTQISFQRPRPGEIIYEDQRYNAAEKTFLNYLKVKPGDLAAITPKAKLLGQTGQFPYRAIATILDDFPSQLNGEINAILKDALGFYASESGFYNRDEEFLVLLQAASHSSAIDRDLAAQAAAAFVQHLRNDPIEIPGDYYGEVQLDPSGKVFPFADRNAAFLFEAIPAIESCNPSLATQLIQQDVKLGQATAGNLNYVSGGFVQGDPTAAEAAQQHSQWLQDSLVSRIKTCQSSNPQAAVQLAQRLNNPESRILGFSAVISDLARVNRVQAQALYQKQFSELAKLSTAMNRFRAIAALVPAAYNVGDSKQYESLSAQAFDIGTGFFAADTKAGRAQNRNGFAELMDLATFTASQRVDMLQPKVQTLPDGWLKAYLWVYEVQGHGKQKAQATVAATCSR